MSEPKAREEWHSKPAEVTHCLFCGTAGRTWMNMGDVPGCSCFEAVRVREKKSEFQLLVQDGKEVITKCSPDLWPALVRAGWLKGKIILTKELSPESVAALHRAVAAVKAELEARGTPGVTKPRPIETKPVDDVTKPSDVVTELTDGAGECETKVAKSTESTCVVCGKSLPVSGTGRPAVYCSNRCRVKSHRMKR